MHSSVEIKKGRHCCQPFAPPPDPYREGLEPMPIAIGTLINNTFLKAFLAFLGTSLNS